MSRQERVSWVSLLVTLIIGYWYFSRVFALPADASLHGMVMAAFVTKLIVIAIVVSIAGEVALRLAQRYMRGDDGEDATARDERDALIDLKSTRNGHGTLIVGLFIVLGQIAMHESVQHWGQFRQARAGADPETVLQLIFAGPLSPLLVAQLLLMVLTLSGAVTYASRIFYYRRGY
jgi:hypothetical protein